MSEEIIKWLYRRAECTAEFWFTVWLFWINKPVWKWVFLAYALISAYSVVKAEESERNQ